MNPDGDRESPDSTSITPTQDDSVVIARIRLVTSELLAFVVKAGDPKVARWSWMIEAFITEGLAEIADSNVNDASIAAALDNFGNIIAWCGHGDPASLPPTVRDYIYKHHKEMLAITSEKVD